MYSDMKTQPSTGLYWDQIDKLYQELTDADAVVIGAGAGLSAAAGLTYDGPRFERLFADVIAKYHVTDMYSAGFYPYESLEAYWAYWSRHIACNRYDQPVGKPYQDLLALVEQKDYFVITTNVDHCFQLAGFSRQRLFYTQGDYGLWQCSTPCCQKTYDNEAQVRQMVAAQKDLRIPADLVPYCPVCGAAMTMNLRCDDRFVQDQGWQQAKERYEAFLRRQQGKRVLFWELGVGGNTPVIIKFPFWRFTQQNPLAAYACVNLGQAFAPQEIRDRSLCINQDLAVVLQDLRLYESAGKA